MIVDKLIDNGPQNVPDWKQYQAYGSWVSLCLKTAYSQVKYTVERWGYTRFIAAYMAESKNQNCSAYLEPLENQTKIDDACQKYPFDTTNM